MNCCARSSAMYCRWLERFLYLLWRRKSARPHTSLLVNSPVTFSIFASGVAIRLANTSAPAHCRSGERETKLSSIHGTVGGSSDELWREGPTVQKLDVSPLVRPQNGPTLGASLPCSKRASTWL